MSNPQYATFKSHRTRHELSTMFGVEFPERVEVVQVETRTTFQNVQVRFVVDGRSEKLWLSGAYLDLPLNVDTGPASDPTAR